MFRIKNGKNSSNFTVLSQMVYKCNMKGTLLFCQNFLFLTLLVDIATISTFENQKSK
jgi:hypothetical protein